LYSDEPLQEITQIEEEQTTCDVLFDEEETQLSTSTDEAVETGTDDTFRPAHENFTPA
jgi:hypothetical protein